MAQLDILEERNTINDNDECANDNESFNFDKWISDNDLNEIIDCFIDYDMNTLNKLDMNSENFIKLMSDDRIMNNQHFVPKILKSILSLQDIRKTEQEIPSQQKPETPKSENEKKVSANIQPFIDNLKQFNNEFQHLVSQYETKKEENNQYINTQTIELKTKFTDMRNKIKIVFETLRDILNLQEQAASIHIDKYEHELDNINKTHHSYTNKVDNICNQSTQIIKEDKAYYMSTQNINKYICKDSEFIETKENATIDTEILVDEYHQKRMKLLNDNNDEINKFISRSEQFTHNKIRKSHSIAMRMDETSYNNICDSLNALVIYFKNSKPEKISTDYIANTFHTCLKADKSEQQSLAHEFYASIKTWTSAQLEMQSIVMVVNFLIWYYTSANVWNGLESKLYCQQAAHIRHVADYYSINDNVKFDYWNIKFDYMYNTALYQKSIPHMKQFYKWICDQTARQVPENGTKRKPFYYLTKYQAACIIGDWDNGVKSVGHILKSISHSTTCSKDYFMQYTLRAINNPGLNLNFGLIHNIVDKLMYKFPISLLPPPIFTEWNILSFKYRNVNYKKGKCLNDKQFILASNKIKTEDGYYLFYPVNWTTNKVNKKVNIFGRICQIESPVFNASEFLPLTGSWSDTKLYLESNWTFEGVEKRLIRKHIIMNVERMPYEQKVRNDKGHIWTGYITVYMQKLKKGVTIKDLNDKGHDYFDGEKAMQKVENNTFDDDDKQDPYGMIEIAVYDVELIINKDVPKKPFKALDFDWKILDDEQDEKSNYGNALIPVTVNKKPFGLHLLMETIDGFNACVAADTKNIGVSYGSKLVRINEQNVDGLLYEEIMNVLKRCSVGTELKFIAMRELNKEWTKAKQLKEEANALYKQGKELRAIEKQSEAIKLNPTNKIFYSNRVLMYLKCNEYERALLDCQIMRALDPFQEYVKGYYLYGLVLMNLKKYKTATFAFQTVNKINPSFAKATDRLNECLAKLKEEKSKSPKAYVF